MSNWVISCLRTALTLINKGRWFRAVLLWFWYCSHRWSTLFWSNLMLHSIVNSPTTESSWILWSGRSGTRKSAPFRHFAKYERARRYKSATLCMQGDEQLIRLLSIDWFCLLPKEATTPFAFCLKGERLQRGGRREERRGEKGLTLADFIFHCCCFSSQLVTWLCVTLSGVREATQLVITRPAIR